MANTPIFDEFWRQRSDDAATLCDIIREWLGADPHWGDFEKELPNAVVEKHGRFE